MHNAWGRQGGLRSREVGRDAARLQRLRAAGSSVGGVGGLVAGGDGRVRDVEQRHVEVQRRAARNQVAVAAPAVPELRRDHQPAKPARPPPSLARTTRVVASGMPPSLARTARPSAKHATRKRTGMRLVDHVQIHPPVCHNLASSEAPASERGHLRRPPTRIP